MAVPYHIKNPEVLDLLDEYRELAGFDSKVAALESALRIALQSRKEVVPLSVRIKQFSTDLASSSGGKSHVS